MTRQIRILFEGAWYHVMNRGVNKQTIFFKTKHRREFIALMEYVSKIYNVEIHAYCLMSNHYHILLRTREPNLPELMRYLESVFAQRINYDMSRDGPLFRGRFKSVLIGDDDHLIYVSRYIHLNPIEAGLSEQMNDPQWSSYPYYIGNQKKPAWMCMDFIRELFGENEFFKEYENYIGDGCDEYTAKFYSQKRIKPIFSTDKFIARLKNTHAKSREIADFDFCRRVVSLASIAQAVCEVTSRSHDEITRSVRGKNNDFRSLFIYISREIYGHKIKEIAGYLSNSHYSCISAAMSRFKKILATSSEWRSIIAVCKMKIAYKINSCS